MIKLCQDCGGRNIEFEAHIRPNENNAVTWMADDACHVWCDDCEKWGVGSIDLDDAATCVAPLLSLFAAIGSRPDWPCGHPWNAGDTCRTCEIISDDVERAEDTLDRLLAESEWRGAWTWQQWQSHTEAIATSQDWLDQCRAAACRK